MQLTISFSKNFYLKKSFTNWLKAPLKKSVFNKNWAFTLALQNCHYTYQISKVNYSSNKCNDCSQNWNKFEFFFYTINATSKPYFLIKVSPQLNNHWLLTLKLRWFKCELFDSLAQSQSILDSCNLILSFFKAALIYAE